MNISAVKSFVPAFLLLFGGQSLAHQPVLVGKDAIVIEKPAISRAFYDELKGRPRTYRIIAEAEFDLYINLLVPKNTNPLGRYSARVYQLTGNDRLPLAEINGNASDWKKFYEPFGGDTYLKGPEYKQRVVAGQYEIDVFSSDDLGKYVLAVGEKESFGPKEIAQVYVAIPQLKSEFFHSNPLGFFITPFGIVFVLVFGAVVYLTVKKIGNGHA